MKRKDEIRLEPLSSMIDHTLLKPDATEEQIIQLAQEAKEHRFASVCINPRWVKTAAKELQGTPVKVCTVIGFPLGATTTAVKVAEAREAVECGAQEIDMVISIGDLKSGNLQYVKQDIAEVVKAAGDHVIVKVIIETSLLNEEQKVNACKLSKEAGAHYVKTSTGFSGGGATEEDIRLMRSVVGEELGVKASGGVRSREDAERMVRAGASRIGTSSGVAIVKGEQGKASY